MVAIWFLLEGCSLEFFRFLILFGKFCDEHEDGLRGGESWGWGESMADGGDAKSFGAEAPTYGDFLSSGLFGWDLSEWGPGAGGG